MSYYAILLAYHRLDCSPKSEIAICQSAKNDVEFLKSLWDENKERYLRVLPFFTQSEAEDYVKSNFFVCLPPVYQIELQKEAEEKFEIADICGQTENAKTFLKSEVKKVISVQIGREEVMINLVFNESVASVVDSERSVAEPVVKPVQELKVPFLEGLRRKPKKKKASKKYEEAERSKGEEGVLLLDAGSAIFRP